MSVNIGSMILRRDLLGIVTKQDDKYLYVLTEEGKTVRVYKEGATEITNPYALTALLYDKVIKERKVKK